MSVTVVASDPAWPAAFRGVEQALRGALRAVLVEAIEHVGSTSVPGLAAKPVIDVDVVVQAEDVPAAIHALTAAGYLHLGDVGLSGREAFRAPDRSPRRNVYVCTAGGLQVRNHLAVRDVLRARPDLAERYGAVKLALAADPDMDIDRYTVSKSEMLQEVLEAGGLTAEELREVRRLNATNGP